MDADYLRDVLDAALRLLHVVAGIAWIGASFYFVRLDLGLHAPRDRADADKGVAGEFWGVHGGGFYHSQKYRVAPRELPEPLHWFKWEAYTTWLSGFALLVVLYWLDADTRLVDPSVADLTESQAVGVSAGGLLAAWFVYNALCRTVGARSDLVLAAILTGFVTVAAWGAGELLAPRAAYLQIGAMLGTIMSANVLFVIIPAHRELVRAKLEGREPDATIGIRAKQRSVHNNYLTLPVVFTMLAGHVPIAFGHERAWLVLVAVAVLLALLRVFFNLWHTGVRAWPILAGVAAGAVALVVWLEPEDPEPAEARAGAVPIEQVQAVIAERCATCHSGAAAPAGVRLESAEQIEARAEEIERQAVDTRAMPPGNSTGMTEEERELLATWLASR
jgi:uncharacterized membrane protein